MDNQKNTEQNKTMIFTDTCIFLSVEETEVISMPHEHVTRTEVV